MNEFYVGTEKIPDWVQKQIQLGRIKFNYDKYGNFENVTVHTVTGIHVLVEGDKIVYTDSGLGVIHKPIKKKRVPVENISNDEEEIF